MCRRRRCRPWNSRRGWSLLCEWAERPRRNCHQRRRRGDRIDFLPGERRWRWRRRRRNGRCRPQQSLSRFGGRVVRAKRLVHGKTSKIHHLRTGLFTGLPTPLCATRYHSLALERETLPESLEVTAWTDDGEVMAVRHRDYADAQVEGVQFHPESILTEFGHDLLRNFLESGEER